jgi:hypothetical protein
MKPQSTHNWKQSLRTGKSREEKQAWDEYYEMGGDAADHSVEARWCCNFFIQACCPNPHNPPINPNPGPRGGGKNNQHRSVIQKEINRRFNLSVDNIIMDDAYSFVQNLPKTVDRDYLEELYYSSDDMNLISNEFANYFNINPKEFGNQGNYETMHAHVAYFLWFALCVAILIIFV